MNPHHIISELRSEEIVGTRHGDCILVERAKVLELAEYAEQLEREVATLNEENRRLRADAP